MKNISFWAAVIFIVYMSSCGNSKVANYYADSDEAIEVEVDGYCEYEWNDSCDIDSDGYTFEYVDEEDEEDLYVYIDDDDEDDVVLSNFQEPDYVNERQPSVSRSSNSTSYRNTSATTSTSSASTSSTKSSSSSDDIVRRWTSPGMLGGTSEYIEYADGSVTCHTEAKCYMCHGTAVCSVCKGAGGTYNSYTQLYYPCGSCLQSGKCKYCSGTGVQHTYTRTDPFGNTMGVGNNNMGPVYVSGDGSGSASTSSSSSGRSTSRSSNSDRYGERSCPTCFGTGECRTCGGKGYTLNSYTGENMVCPNCTSLPGKCSYCNGTGKRYGLK